MIPCLHRMLQSDTVGPPKKDNNRSISYLTNHLTNIDKSIPMCVYVHFHLYVGKSMHVYSCTEIVLRFGI